MLQKTVSQLKEIVATEREQSKRREEEQTKSVLENSRVSSLETCIKELNLKIDALEEEKRSSESRESLERSLIDADRAKLKRSQDEQAAELGRERAENTELRSQVESFKLVSARIPELEKQIEERDRNIDSLITEKRDYEMQALLEKSAIDSDRAKLNKLQKEETKLKQEIASCTSNIETLETSIRNLEKVAEATNCDLLREQAETTKLRSQIKDIVSELENKIERLNRDIDTLETQKRDSETQALLEKPSIDSDRAKLKKLQEEETKLKQEVALGTSQIHMLETSVKTIKTAAKATNGELLRERAETMKLRDQIKETASEVARVTELEAKIEKLNRSIDSLETEKRDHEMQALLEKSAIDSDRAKLKKVQTEETKLKQELASCTSNIQTLETSVKNLEKAAETNKAELLKERAEITKLRDQVHDAAWEGARVTELETKIEELNRNIDSLETEKRDYETQALLEKPAIDSDRAKLKKLQEEEIRLTQLVASHTSQVQTLETSVKNLHKVAEDERKASAYINSVASSYIFLQANVQHKTQITRLEDRIKVFKQTIECLEGEKRNLELHSSAQPLIASDREELKKLREANTIFEAGRSSIIELQKKLQECETSRASSDTRHRTLTETLNKLQKQITESVPKVHRHYDPELVPTMHLILL
ncbi:zipper-like domain-containing protein [Lentinula edodes]|uniref:Zipper-like domain-containing protein n=1 Tax=Lentinula edodes TaxID=5353 RepID=A0A1Q3EKI3_LENED|nr:zipper-like domain-containing protein [Lentinula edodes]